METNFQKWISKEKEWMRAYHKRTMRKLTHVTTPLVIVILSLFFGGMALLGGAPVTDVIYTVICGAVMGAVMMGIVILIVGAGTSVSRMQKGIFRAVKGLGLSETEQNQLATEMLEAAGNKEKELAFESKSPDSANALPVCVTVTEHFAYMKGDAPFVNIIRRADVEHIETAEEKRETTRHGAKMKTYYTFWVYAICFIGKDGKSIGGFGFFDEQLRDEVLSMF